jgi:hypothetical protein
VHPLAREVARPCLGPGGAPTRVSCRRAPPATHAPPLPARTPPRPASPSKLSLNFFDNDRALKGGDSIIAKGYDAVPKLLEAMLASKKGRVLTGTPVTAVEYTPQGVTVRRGWLGAGLV